MLVPIRLAMTVLWLAEAGVFELVWSEAILTEVERNLPKVGLTSSQAASRVGQMREGFRAALVDDFEHLIPAMRCHPKDRHVLAAATRAAAGTLVTFNLKDFPQTSTSGHGVEVMHPDLFLISLLRERTAEVLATLVAGVADLHNPPMAARTFLTSLTPTVPRFAALASAALS